MAVRVKPNRFRTLQNTLTHESKPKNKQDNPIPDIAAINICLNCTEKTCRGYCDKIRKLGKKPY